jgi:CRISPR system Cascade subunit CasD
MSTLLLRLAGPMQSWGIQSRFTIRDTGLEPSKSGVIGLLAAALGRKRQEPLDDLASLKMGVRVDREGLLKMDFHTAGGVHRRDERYGVARADGSGPSKDPVVSQRYYLADADFLVGLESDDEAWLHRLDAALARPVWPLYLGRRAFVPGRPIRVGHRPSHLPGPSDVPGIVHLPLRDALNAYPYPVRTPREKNILLKSLEQGESLRLRAVLEAEPGSTGEVRPDQPLSFAIHRRDYSLRYVHTDYLTLSADHIQEEHHVSFTPAA